MCLHTEKSKMSLKYIKFVFFENSIEHKHYAIKLDDFAAFCWSIYGPHCDEICLWVFRQSETQTSLLSYRD